TPLAIEPRHPRHIDRDAIAYQLPTDTDAWNGVVVARSPRVARLDAQSAISIQYRCRQRLHVELQLVVLLLRVHRPVRAAADLPVVEPHPERICHGARQSECVALILLRKAESVFRHVGHCEMPDIDLPRAPRRGRWRGSSAFRRRDGARGGRTNAL